jgi:hypothetical protein
VSRPADDDVTRPKPPGGEAQYESCLRGNKRMDLPVEAQIAALAERQHGVVTLPQLQSLGEGAVLVLTVVAVVLALGTLAVILAQA